MPSLLPNGKRQILKLRIPPPNDTKEVLSERWGLTNHQLLVETKKASVFKVDSPEGPAAFKLYSEIGNGNERSAVAFSKSLPRDVGARIIRSNFLRAAVLIEWLDGPPLAKKYHAGEYAEPTRKACELIAKLSTVKFQWGFAYRRLTPLVKQRIKASAGPKPSADEVMLLKQALQLFEEHFNQRRLERIVHGDLHYDNMIETPNGIRMFDPKGLRAHPMMELVNILKPPKTETDLLAFEERIKEQISIISSMLGFRQEELFRFLLFQTLINALKSKSNPKSFENYRKKLAAITQLANPTS